MRILLASAVLAAALPCSAGGIDMGLTNPAGPAAPAPAAAQGESGLKQLDAALGQAAAAAKELETVLEQAEATMRSSPKGAVTDYRKLFMQKMEADCRASFQASDVAVAAKDSMLVVPVSRYLACLAVASKGTAVCVVPSDPKVKEETPQGNCIDAYTLARFTDALASGGDAVSICKQGHAARGGAGDGTAVCKAVAAGSCDGGESGLRPFDDKPHCQAVLAAAVRGEAGACARAKKYDGSQGYTCADMAAIRAARKGGSCGGSALCQALVTGKADACVPLLAGIKQGHCDTVVKAKATRDAALIDAAAKEFKEKTPPPHVAAMEAVTAKRKLVDAHLVALGTALDGYEPKTNPDFASRPARYREIRRKVDAALKRFKLATETPPAKAAKP